MTIRDIAEMAGVSIATVSMVLNNKPGVSEKTARRIWEVVEALDFVPSASAQALKTNHSRSLGMIVGQLSNAYHIDMITAAEEEAYKYGYQLFLCNANLSWQRTLKHIRTLRSRIVDGILLSVSMTPDEQCMKDILSIWKSGLPMVSLSSNTQEYPLPIVSFRLEAQIAEAIHLLHELGHRQIGMVAAPEGSWGNYRLDCFREVAAGLGIYNEGLVVYAENDLYSAKESVRKLLVAHPAVTAIYAVNDMMALSVLQVADELGISVPEELSIVGTDGIPYVDFTRPNIATIRAPLKELAKTATQQLISMVEDKSFSENERLLIPCTFTKGGSIAKACR